MSEYKSWLYARLQQLDKIMPFAALLDLRAVDFDEGKCTVSIPVIMEKHTNPEGFIHGGVLASMADTAMGAACATLGKRICTLEMNINYIKNVPSGAALTATAVVIHNGKRTMVSETEIHDAQGRLLVKGRGTFFVLGYYEESNMENGGVK